MASQRDRENPADLPPTPEGSAAPFVERRKSPASAPEPHGERPAPAPAPVDAGLRDRRSYRGVELHSLETTSAAPDLLAAPQAAGAALYRWTIASDVLEWSENVSYVLSVADPSSLITGRGYAALLDADNVANRYDTIVAARNTDPGDGVPYSITYRLRPRGRNSEESAWVEDTGRWYAGSDGKPAAALGMVRRIDRRYREEERLNFLARFDALTGHLNRSGLAEALEQAVAASNGRDRSCAFLLTAIDRLAMINESYGFDVADDLIAQVGRRLETALRSGDTIGRYAGNKIGLILVNTTEDAVRGAADRILESVQGSAIQTEAGSVPVTISMGGVVIPRHARTAREAMMRAEDALGHTRARPVGGFCLFDHSEQREPVRRRNIKIADEIVSALNERRFAIAYQPIVPVIGGQPAMYECLLRMIRPNREIVSAGMFIETAEELGLARLIDLRVLELVLEALRRGAGETLTLNVSALTAMSPEWLDSLELALRSDRALGRRLIVEFTETVAIKDIEASTRFVSALKELGCRVAIDDFGAGYTSFRNLKLLDVDLVKIDGSFIRDLNHNPGDQVFVKALVDLAHNFDLPTVAEWVTCEQDARLLQSWGVDYLQGFYFGEASMRAPWASALQIAPARTKA